MRLKLTFLILMALAMPIQAKGTQPFKFEQITPSPLGYQVGSIISHKLLIATQPGWRLVTERLPGPGAVNPWLEIRQIDWHQKQSRQGKQYQVKIDYQIFPSLKQPTDLTLPDLQLFFEGPQGETVKHSAPPWQFTVSPMIPPHWRDDQVPLRPLWQPSQQPVTPYLRHLSWLVTGIFLLLIFYWWQRRGFSLFTTPNPFRKALPTIRKAGKKGQTEIAFKAFHHALNQAAKQALHPDQIPDFIQTHPAFSGLEAQLQRFFQYSRRFFFEGSSQATYYSVSELEELCRQCAEAEKQCPR